MAQQISSFWTNLAVGILGLLVGLDYLLRWASNESFTRGLVIGVLCTLFATIWLIYVFLKRNTKG